MDSEKKHLIFVATVAILITISTGTIVFHFIENWSWIDAYYFTVITISTVGYGDLTPTHPISKFLTTLLIFSGVTIALTALSIIGKARMMKRVDTFNKRVKKK